MKNMIFTLISTRNSNKEFDELFKITKYYMKYYADRIDADFDVIQVDYDNWADIVYSRLDGYKYFQDHDNVLYLDADVFVKKDAPNIFESVPKDRVVMFNEFNLFKDENRATPGFKYFTSRYNLELIRAGRSEEALDPIYINPRQFFNDGIVLCPNKYKFLFEPPISKVMAHTKEQDLFNFRIVKNGIDVVELDLKFCAWYNCASKYTPEEEAIVRKDAYFNHLGGDKKVERVIEYMKLFNYDLNDHIEKG